MTSHLCVDNFSPFERVPSLICSISIGLQFVTDSRDRTFLFTVTHGLWDHY